jgi:hypothetical protein
LAESLGWKMLEKRVDHIGSQDSELEVQKTRTQQLEYFIPGGGIAQKFYKSRYDSNSIRGIVL